MTHKLNFDTALPHTSLVTLAEILLLSLSPSVISSIKGKIIELSLQNFYDLLKIFNELISIDLEKITVQEKY